jgi:hypothetical protein
MKRGDIENYENGYVLCIADGDRKNTPWFPTLDGARLRREIIRLQEEERKEVSDLIQSNTNEDNISGKIDEIHQKYKEMITWVKPVAWKNDPT